MWPDAHSATLHWHIMDLLVFERVLTCIFIFHVFHESSQFLLDNSPDNLERCPDTVTHGNYLHSFREKCYEFVIYKEKYWADARHDCQNKGGDLVVVDDPDIQTFIIATLATLRNTKQGLWIGLTDSQHELHWQWVNGETLQGYNNWAHLEGGANALHFTQDCTQIRMNDNGRWHDRECHLWPQKFSYICQFDMLPLPIVPTTAKSSIRTSTMITTAIPSSTTSTAALPSSTKSAASLVSSTTSTSLPTSTKQSKPNVSMTDIPTTTLDLNIENSTQYGFNSSSPWQHKSMSGLISVLTYSTVSSTSVESDVTESSSKIDSVLPSNTPNASTTLAITKLSNVHLTSLSVAKDDVTSTEKSVICSEVDCAKSCPNGYSGVYVNIDGCVHCRCNKY